MRKLRLGFEEALHFDLRAEPSAGKSFESFSQDRSVRLIPNEQIAVTGCALVAIADRSLKAPVAIKGARPHAVDSLFPVLLALVLGDGGEQVFDKNGVGIFAELDGRTFKASASGIEIGTQGEVCFQPARKTRNVVNDARHHWMRSMLSATTYFCDAYASWQKGGIENANGRIRRWLPRKMNLDALSDEDIEEIAMTMNLTLRKCLGFRSPVEAFLGELGKDVKIRFR